LEGQGVTVEFFVALRSAERVSVINHDFGIGMHCGKCIAVSFAPAAKTKARRFELHDSR